MSAAEEVVAGRKKDMAGNCLMILPYEFEEKVKSRPLSVAGDDRSERTCAPLPPPSPSIT